VAGAGRLWDATEALHQALGVPLPPSKRAEYEPYLAAAIDKNLICEICEICGYFQEEY